MLSPPAFAVPSFFSRLRSLSPLSIGTERGTATAIVRFLTLRRYPMIHILNGCHRSIQHNYCSNPTTLPTAKFLGSRPPARQRFSTSSRPRTPYPSLSHTYTEVSLPMSGSGADYNTEKKKTWTTHHVYFINCAGGSTSYQHVNMIAVLLYDGAPLQVTGGIGVFNVYHRSCVNVERRGKQGRINILLLSHLPHPPSLIQMPPFHFPFHIITLPV